jgi:NADH-quinone oxidoreductase subunit C
MTENPTVARLRAQFPAAVTGVTEFRDETTVSVTREAIVPVCQFLRDDPDLAYSFLVDLTSVDYLEYPHKQARFAVVYLLHSYKTNERIRLKVWLNEDDTVAPTVSNIWRAANWLEREVFDMMGITFSGHPDLRRILLPPDWEGGYPQRKDFPVFGVKDPLVRVKGSRENFDK